MSFVFNLKLRAGLGLTVVSPVLAEAVTWKEMFNVYSIKS